MNYRGITGMVLLLAGLAGGAQAVETTLNVENFKAKLVPADDSYEQAQLCASMFYLDGMINKLRSPDAPNYDRYIKSAETGLSVWIPRALAKYNAAAGEPLTRESYADTVIKPNGERLYDLWDKEEIPGATLGFFEQYYLHEMVDVWVTTAPN